MNSVRKIKCKDKLIILYSKEVLLKRNISGKRKKKKKTQKKKKKKKIFFFFFSFGFNVTGKGIECFTLRDMFASNMLLSYIERHAIMHLKIIAQFLRVIHIQFLSMYDY